jgi:ketosteroid isomerase-like protein
VDRTQRRATVAEPSGREIVERYAKAMSDADLESLNFLLADNLVEEYPQSGERIVGLEPWIALMRHWPEVDPVTTHIERVVGSDDEWVAGPSWGLMKISGTGDEFWGHGTVRYSNGETWHIVQLLTLRNGRIAHIRSYFAAPFPAPDWRRSYVERMDPEA